MMEQLTGVQRRAEDPGSEKMKSPGASLSVDRVKRPGRALKFPTDNAIGRQKR